MHFPQTTGDTRLDEEALSKERVSKHVSVDHYTHKYETKIKKIKGTDTQHIISRNVLILERFISISNVFQTTDNNTFLVVSPADLIISQQKQLIMFVKLYVCYSVCLLVSYVNYP